MVLLTSHTFGIQVEQVAIICTDELGQEHNNSVFLKLDVTVLE